ncbi:hypothetical protein BS47DRAFT_329851 [Hydnum rufescens UP504]|uniref:Uncharacterized protein n=1 Tax=Hydnum rufescens UP504 TaxID=1448309 RepID=A0A9P6B6M2_9AGAM|nr:hypothetical protein BS47DRAFT_329851 [Hydnum rufescens UP504]
MSFFLRSWYFLFRYLLENGASEFPHDLHLNYWSHVWPWYISSTFDDFSRAQTSVRGLETNIGSLGRSFVVKRATKRGQTLDPYKGLPLYKRCNTYFRHYSHTLCVSPSSLSPSLSLFLRSRLLLPGMVLLRTLGRLVLQTAGVPLVVVVSISSKCSPITEV